MRLRQLFLKYSLHVACQPYPQSLRQLPKAPVQYLPDRDFSPLLPRPKAAVNLQKAQSDLARMQILYDGGDLSDQEYEQYTNSVKTAQLQYNSAKTAYDQQVGYSSGSPERWRAAARRSMTGRT